MFFFFGMFNGAVDIKSLNNKTVSKIKCTQQNQLTNKWKAKNQHVIRTIKCTSNQSFERI